MDEEVSRRRAKKRRRDTEAADMAVPTVASQFVRLAMLMFAKGDWSPQLLQKTSSAICEDIIAVGGDPAKLPELVFLKQLGSEGKHKQHMHRQFLT